MALIHCPECKREVSDHAYACPHCGFPVEDYLEDQSAFEGLHKSLRVEVDLTEEDDGDVSSDENGLPEEVMDVNGIMVNPAKILAANHYEIGAASKMLNRVTKVGIVQAKEIMETFVAEHPQCNRGEAVSAFIREQAEMTRTFRCTKRIDNLRVDEVHHLFHVGFWSYIYPAREIEDVHIREEYGGRVSVIVDLATQEASTLQINLPHRKNIKDIMTSPKLKKIKNLLDVKKLHPKSLRIPPEISREKATAIRNLLLHLRAEALDAETPVETTTDTV
ncbi:MAG: hypothetical protein Q4P30_05430 [Eubacteriales bacterium]|nr:hypothetical protein [Eubacteriales bacterium]